MQDKLYEKLNILMPEIFNFSDALDKLYISFEEINERTSQKERNGIKAMMYIMNEHYKVICDIMGEIDELCMEYQKENIEDEE